MIKATPPDDAQAAFLAELERALPDAHIPSLMAALVHLTGDAGPLRAAPRPVYGRFSDNQGELPSAVQAQARKDALEAMARRLRGAPQPPQPDRQTLRMMMDFVAGAELPERYIPLLLEQLAMDGPDPRRPDWRAPGLRRAAADMRVLIIGAGASGLLMALRLQQAGVSFQIVEKNADVGGTWLENDYPGCRVDTPNHLYSLSFEGVHDWPSYFSKQGVLLRYFQQLADAHGLREHIRFQTTVTGLTFDEHAQRWRCAARDAGGQEVELVATHVVSAVGQLNEPRFPDIPGRDRFAGTAFHSARWRHDVDLAGKRVSVIGTGASAFQFVPEIAPVASDVTIFQRSPPWLVPTYEYHDDVPANARWLLEHVPFYEKWYRFRLFWKMTEGIFEAVTADPDWEGPPTAIGEVSAGVRQLLVEEIAKQCVGAEHLMDIVVPDYPFGGKRPLRDNGTWIKALRRPNVHVVTAPITEIVEDGVKTADGTVRPADVLIYGTGYRASEFLRRIEVRGRGGTRLQEAWEDDARSYLGVTVPGFPNFFMLYGPNTNIAVNGSIIFMIECATNYIMDCLRMAAERGAAVMEVREDVYEAYNREVDAANRMRAWGAPQSKSWYKNAKGRVSQNWPHKLIDYWTATRHAAAGDYILEPAHPRQASDAARAEQGSSVGY